VSGRNRGITTLAIIWNDPAQLQFCRSPVRTQERGALSGVLAAPLLTGYLSAPAPDAPTVAPAVGVTSDWGDTTGSGPIGAVADNAGVTGWITSAT
jgi:hypothetical protein